MNTANPTGLLRKVNPNQTDESIDHKFTVTSDNCQDKNISKVSDIMIQIPSNFKIDLKPILGNSALVDEASSSDHASDFICDFCGLVFKDISTCLKHLNGNHQ